MSDHIKVALIGCGRIAGHHCRSIQLVDGIALVAVCDLVEERAKSYGQQYHVPWYTNYHEMLIEVPEILLVAVITPSGMHYEHAMDIMQRYKKHLVIEKPTFMRPDHLSSAYHLADELKLKIFPVFQNRYNKAVNRVKQALETEELGKIYLSAVRVRWCRSQRYYELAPWRGTFSHDGGALTNQGVHHVDLLRYLGGEIRCVNCTMHTFELNIEVENAAIGTFEYESGALGTVEVTTAARPLDFEASISIVGSKGLAQIGGIAVNELQIFTPDPAACDRFSEDFSGCIYGNGHQQIYRNIVSDLKGETVYPIDKKNCLSTIWLLNAFYRSDEVRNWVDLSDHPQSTRLGRDNEQVAQLYRTPALVEV